jgi:hypothetical protein
MFPKKANDHTIEEFGEREGEESSVVEVRGIMIRMLDKLKEELKEDKQKQLNETQENNDKKLKKSEKQLNEYRGFQQTPK